MFVCFLEYPTYKEGELQHFPEQQSVFYSSFRPNFVKKYPEPLCSYGLTAAIQNDPNKDHHNNLLRNATNHLFDVVIPGFAAEMVRQPSHPLFSLSVSQDQPGFPASTTNHTPRQEL